MLILSGFEEDEFKHHFRAQSGDKRQSSDYITNIRVNRTVFFKVLQRIDLVFF